MTEPFADISLIPLKAGSLTVPEIKIPWWNIQANHIAYAEVPAQNIDVLPAPSTTSATPPNVAPSAQTPAPSAASPLQTTDSNQTPWFWYALVAFLGIALFSLAVWALSLQRKVNRQDAETDTENTSRKETKAMPQPSTDIEWDNIRTAEDLNRSLLAYAHDHWGTPRNAALEAVFAQQQEKLSSKLELADTEMIAHELSAALYAGQTIDLEAVKARCSRIIAALNKPTKTERDPPEKLPCLNPS